MPNILPTKVLRNFVSHYMLLHVQVKGVSAEQRIKPFPPDAEQSLYFYPRDVVKNIVHSSSEIRDSASSIYVGQQTSRINLQFGEDHLVIQVCFRAGMMHQLLGKIPITEFQEKEVDAEDFSDNEMKFLNEELRETNNYQVMISLIDNYLLKKVNRLTIDNQPIDRAIAFMKDGDKSFSLDWLADQACLSPRQFERKFRDRLGMNPKYYSRIVRFNRAYQMKMKQPNLDWLAIAYTCDYYDFAHLMRDFKAFAEVTPSMLVAQELSSPDGKRAIYI
ncbi:helix-turn-helix domain-containing protein [Arcicella aurantiaca]|nr:helix-turn-helix domain-containing protein [Arcicella aurantiaca]